MRRLRAFLCIRRDLLAWVCILGFALAMFVVALLLYDAGVRL